MTRHIPAAEVVQSSAMDALIKGGVPYARRTGDVLPGDVGGVRG